MTRFPAGLVWLASYPKSGNTWMRVLLANLMADKDHPADINRLSEDDTLLGNWRFGDDMLVDPDLLDAVELGRMRRMHTDHVAASVSGPFFCKTHDRFDPATLGTRARRAIYLVRDPRDVAISLSHHTGLSLDNAIACMADPDCRSDGAMQLRYPLGDWRGHVAGWTGQRDIPVATIRYEDLRRDTAGVLRSIVDFLGGQASDAAIARTVAHSSLAELQKQENARGFRESRPGQARFFRAGRIGEWRDVMTPDQVHRVERRFLPVMAQWGYSRGIQGEEDGTVAAPRR